ncbi:hypothetical protein [Deinococcus arenae]|nr:hypothetical protein [Deinococcus arenae]
MNVKRVITTDDQNIQEFNALNADLRAEKMALQQTRAATEAARLALPTQVQAITGPAVQAAQSAASLAVQRAGVVGSVPNEAALAGRAAGDYRVGMEIVTWNGNAVTARTAVLASDADVQEARALAQEADSKADTASDLAGEVQAKTAPAVATLADTFGGRTFAGLRAAIQAGANQLADADYPADGTPLTLTPANPIRGRGRKITRLTTQAGVTPAGPVLVDLGSVTDSDPTKAHSGVTLASLTIADTAQVGGAGVGLLWRGSHRTVRDVSVRGFYGGGSAVQFDAANTYCATLDTFDLFDGSFGVTLPANPANSGERIAFSNGSIFNVQTSCLRVLAEGWFVKLHNVSLDYPGVSAIQAGAPLSVDMHQCHLEWSAPGQPHLPLVSSTAGCTDFGIITLTGCDLVHFVTGNLTFPDLIGPGLQRGTVILRDCLVTWVDGGNVRRQRVTRAFTHHVPFGGVAPVGGQAYQNDTAAALRLVLRVTLPAGGSWAAYTGDTSGTGNMAAFVNSASSAAEHTVTVDVPAGHYYKLSNTATLLRSEFLA